MKQFKFKIWKENLGSVAKIFIHTLMDKTRGFRKSDKQFKIWAANILNSKYLMLIWLPLPGKGVSFYFKGDSLKRHNGLKFSTLDQDNDADSGNCASMHKGGWWYDHCFDAELNGGFWGRDLYWKSSGSFKSSSMMIKKLWKFIYEFIQKD